MVINIMLVSATGFTQETKLTLKLKDATLKEVISEIESQSSFSFLYKADALNFNEKVNVEASNTSIEDVLNNLFSQKNIQYKILDNSLIVLLPSSNALQQIKVTGKLTDATTGGSLPGVNIVVEGTMIGTTSDLNGQYTIEVPNANSSLILSYVGYKTETVAVGGRTTIDVTLVPEITKLDEVVVVGYGLAKRGNLTTAQTSISAKDLEKTVNTTIEQAIQGRTAGVYITQNSGQPGGGISVNIRGVNSINGTNEPLYVIDGIQIAGQSISSGPLSSSNPLAGLNPNDIADIQVLQGPSATALYGSRATNGVLLITTKRGKAGDTKINYSYQYTLQTPPKHLDVMDLQQYAQMTGEFHAALGGSTPTEFLDPSILGKGTDWQSAMFKNSGMYKHQLSVSGGKEKTTYYLSGEYLSQDGVAIGSGFDRYGVRLNLDTKPKEWISIGTNLSFNQIKDKLTTSSEGVIFNALTETPQVPVKNIDGSWGGGDNSNGANNLAPVNPVALASLITNNDTRRQFFGGLNADINIFKGLVFRTTFNTNFGYGNSIYYKPNYHIGWAINPTASLTDQTNTNTYWNWNQLLEYTKQVGKHNFDVMASHESQESQWKNNGTVVQNFLTNDVIDVNAGDASTFSGSGGQGVGTMESYLGKLSYNYAEKYLLLGTLRTDGSSNFGQNNKWGLFPALSVAWRISKEGFFHVPFINDLKIRLETGTTGNQGSGGIYSPMAAYPTQWGTGFLPNQYANPDLKWESTKTNNIGLNIALFENRITLDADYYKKSTDNLLMSAQEPWYMGTAGNTAPASPTVNLGSLENKGWAFTLNTVNVSGKDFKWESNFNISGVKTKITKLNSNAAFVDRISWWMNNWTQRSAVGEGPWLFRGYKQAGIFQSVDEINNSAVPVDNSGVRLPTDVNNVWVGDVKYKDISGPNGVPDGIIDTYDQTNIGNPYPKFFGGFTNSFTYKGIQLSILLTYSYGNDIYNFLAWQNSNPNQINLSRNLMTSAENYAKPITQTDGTVVLSNPGTDLPRLSYGPNGNWARFTNNWVEDGSYLRVKNISLSYSIPAKLLSVQKLVKDVRVVLSAQNIATLTGYKGYDPEIGAYVGQNADPNTQAYGVDYGRYPLTPIYTFNLLLTF